MNKIKKIIYWLLPLIIAIYQVYLINRIWELPKRCTIAVALFFLATLYIMFYFYYIKIKHALEKANKKIEIWIIIVATVLSILCLATNFDFFTKKYTESTIVISENDQNGNLSKELSINGLIIDNVKQDIENKIQLNPLELNFEKSKDIIIEFKSDRKNGIVSIKDGNELKEIDLYSFNDSYIEYNVNSNKSMSLFSIIRLICSFIMLEILFVMFCKASYYLYTKDKNLLLPMLLIVACIQHVFYVKSVAFTLYPDTENYKITNPFSTHLNGRTPVYPFIIKMMLFLCENYSYEIILSKIQIIVSFISLIFLYKTIIYITKKEYIALLITFLYGISTAVLGWNNAILTESFSLSGTVILCYLIVKYLKEVSIKYGICAIILSIIITFLKPACIIYPVILFAFFLLRILVNKENRKTEIKCFIISLISIILILIYATIFYKQYNIFSISDAKVRQDLYVCIDQGFYKNSGNEEFIKKVDESFKIEDNPWKIMSLVYKEYNNKEIQKLIRISRNNSIRQYINYINNLIIQYSTEKYSSYMQLCFNFPNTRFNNILSSFNILQFGNVYIIMIIEFIIGIILTIKNKKIDWLNLGVFVFLFSILFTAFIGTNGEFMRTSICVIPFSYIGICNIIINIIKVNNIIANRK